MGNPGHIVLRLDTSMQSAYVTFSTYSEYLLANVFNLSSCLDMKIAIILGSIRQGRQTHLIVNYLNQRLNEMDGITSTILDLGTFDLPILADQWRKQENPDPALVEFSKALLDSDGIVMASPEYHGSYSGVLKNAVDHFWQEFSRKPMAVVATGSGNYGGINASSQMQHLVLSLGAFAMPQKLLVPHVNKVFDEHGMPAQPQLVKQVNAFMKELIWFTRAIATAHLGDNG